MNIRITREELEKIINNYVETQLNKSVENKIDHEIIHFFDDEDEMNRYVERKLKTLCELGLVSGT